MFPVNHVAFAAGNFLRYSAVALGQVFTARNEVGARLYFQRRL